MRVNYDYKNRYGLYTKGAYHSWNVENQEHAWQPTWDADLGGYAKINNNISINTQFMFQDGQLPASETVLTDETYLRLESGRILRLPRLAFGFC